MLNVFFGEMPEAVYSTSMYFDNTYLDKWLEDELVRRMIADVDKAKVLGRSAVESRALGVIPVTKLSGGVKTLILIYKEPKKIFNASTCGDNCAKWILEISKRSPVDITINLRHIMEFGGRPFEIRIANNGAVVHSMAELVAQAIPLLQSKDGGDE